MAPLEAPSGGSFPTFLVGQFAVKLFSETFYSGSDRFWGAVCHEAERSVFRLLRDHPEVPAPVLVEEGQLFEKGWPWPYLISTRLSGTPWREAPPSAKDARSIARELGEVVRALHALPLPEGSVWERDWLELYRAECVDRHRRWGTLPPHLIEQIPGYLAAPPPMRRLLHADLHESHIFVDGGGLTGILDWSDAVYGDPYYELVAIHLGPFKADKELLRAFLVGYGWRVGKDFAHRAMSMALIHEFASMRDLAQSMEVNRIGNLDELAELLWAL